jgi:hypothetical protein
MGIPWLVRPLLKGNVMLTKDAPEHQHHAKLHEERLINAARPGRLPLVPLREKTEEEKTIQASIYLQITALEQSLLSLPDNPHRNRAVQTLEHLVGWVEHTLTYRSVILPEEAK